MKRQIPSILRHPVAIGMVAVALIAVAIMFFGARLLTNDFLDGVDSRQLRNVAQLSQTVHYSGLLGSDRDAVREQFAGVVASSEFDALIRRSLFGFDVARFDIYSLDGTLLYTTDRVSGAAAIGSTAEFERARRGFPASSLERGAVVTDLNGASATRDILSTYALIEDVPADGRRGGRPLAIFAIHGDVGDSLHSLRTTIFYIAGVFIGGLAVIFVIVYRVASASRQRLQAANDALQAQYREVRDSRERMLAADEAAKRAIAEELHGTVQTKLYAVWMKLSAIAATVRAAGLEQADELDDIVDDVDAIREDDIRKLSHRLHPGIVRVGALAGLRSLRDYYERLVPVELEVGEAAAALESAGSSLIPERIRLAAYRIAETALGNVVKHAQASGCLINWDYDAALGALVLTVSDDGVGFDRDAGNATGIGLVTVSDYADALGGSFTVTSAPGKGTQLEVRLPFHEAPGSPTETAAAPAAPEASAPAETEGGSSGVESIHSVVRAEAPIRG